MRTVKELALAATATVDKMQPLLTTTEQLLRVEALWPQVGQVSDGGNFVLTGRRTPAQHALLLRAMTSAAVHRRWLTHKVAPSIHPDMVPEIAQCGSNRMPTRVFDDLAYVDPMVVFPNPLPVTVANGAAGDLLGFYVCGRRPRGHRRVLCSTHDPARDELFVMALTKLRDEPEIDVTSLGVPLVGETFTVDEAVGHSLEEIATKGTASASADGVVAWTKTLLALALNTVLYLCIDDPDVTEYTPAPPRKRVARRKRNRQDEDAGPRIVAVGWRLGPAFKAARERARERSTATPRGSGRGRLVPHHRKAHYQHYWTGPGRTQSVLRFIKPYPVNGGQPAREGVVVPVLPA